MLCDYKDHQNAIQFVCTDSKCANKRLACIQCLVLDHNEHQHKCQEVKTFLQQLLYSNEQKIIQSESQDMKDRRLVLQNMLHELIQEYQNNLYKGNFKYTLDAFKDLIQWDQEKQLSNTQNSTSGSSNQDAQNQNDEELCKSEIIFDFKELEDIKQMAGLSQRGSLKEQNITNLELIKSVSLSIRQNKQETSNNQTNLDVQQLLSLSIKGEKYQEKNYMEGDQLFCKQKYQDAVIKFNEAIRVNKKNDMAWYHKIMSLNFLNEQENCLQTIKEAKMLFPESIDIYYIHGVITEQQQNYLEALDLYKFYIQKNQTYDDVFYRAGNCEFLLFQIDNKRGTSQAIKYLEKTINLNKNHVKAYFLLGIIWQRILEFKNAELCFRYIIDEIDSNNFPSYYQLANCLKNLKQYQTALKVNSQFLILQPQNLEGLIQKGQILFLNNEHFEALNLLDQLKTKYPNQQNIINAIFKDLKIEQQK